jgi:hypothetical protein
MRMSRLRVAIIVGITLRRGRRASDEIKVVREEFRLAQRRRVVAAETVILELGEGKGILFSDPVVNTRVS